MGRSTRANFRQKCLSQTDTYLPRKQRGGGDPKRLIKNKNDKLDSRMGNDSENRDQIMLIVH